MSRKIFVANFSFNVEDENLSEFFGKAGTVVSAKVMKESASGRSRGFGFVEMSSEEEAKGAIDELDGAVWDGRVIKVTEDISDKRQRENRQDSSGSYSGGGHSSSYGGSSHGGGNHHGSSSSERYAERSAAPRGYFRAQPLELTLKKKRKLDPFEEDPTQIIDYKDAKLYLVLQVSVAECFHEE